MKQDMETMSFWDHLDVLRGALVRMAFVAVVCGIAAFCFKDEVFSVILAPKSSGFITYRWFAWIGERLGVSAAVDTFSVSLVNTGLAEQFAIHVKTALYVGCLVSSPYTLYSLMRFITPALYANERRYTFRVVICGYVMFLVGVLLNYYLIFPFTFRFLGTYQVSGEVANMITLQSYMDTLLMMTLMVGILFELPVVCWLLGKLGLLSRSFMRRYRRHAIVVILVIAAVITPTGDAFTLLLVALPVWMLYEMSVLLVPDR